MSGGGGGSGTGNANSNCTGFWPLWNGTSGWPKTIDGREGGLGGIGGRGERISGTISAAGGTLTTWKNENGKLSSMDVKIGDKIWDIKSASPWSFENKFGESGGFETLKNDDTIINFPFKCNFFLYKIRFSN